MISIILNNPKDAGGAAINWALENCKSFIKYQGFNGSSSREEIYLSVRFDFGKIEDAVLFQLTWE